MQADIPKEQGEEEVNIPDEDRTEEPGTEAASSILTALPINAAEALALYERQDDAKVLLKFKPIGAAPTLAQPSCRISASQKLETVAKFLRKRLHLNPSDSLVLYVASSFAPPLDEVMGNLYKWMEVCI